MARAWQRRLLWWGGASVAALAAVVLAAALTFQTSWFRDVVRRLAVSHASALIDGDLAIGSLSGSLLGGVTLTGVVLTETDGTVARIDSLSVTYDIPGFLHKRAAFGTVVLTHPVVWLRQGADGWNVTHLLRAKTTPGAAPWLVTIGRVRVIDGDVHVVPRSGPSRDLTDVTFDGALENEGPTFSLNVRALSGRDRNTGLRIQSLTGDLAMDPHVIRADRVDVATGASHLAGHGSYTRGAPSTLDAAVDADALSLAELRPYLPDAAPQALLVRGHASLHGPPAALETTWALTTDAGQTSGHLIVDATHTPVSMNGDVGTTALNLARITNDAAPTTSLTFHGRVAGALDTSALALSRFTFAVDATSIQVATYAAANVHATGTMAQGDVRAQGEADAYGAHATFDGMVNGIRRATTVAIESSGVVSGVDLTGLPAAWRAPAWSTTIGGRYTFAWRRGSLHASLSADPSRIEDARVDAGAAASVVFDGERLAVTFDGTVHDVSGALVHAPFRQPLVVGGAVHTAFAIAHVSRVGAIGEWSGHASADLAGSQFAGAGFDRATVDATIDGGLLSVRQLDLHSSSLGATASGTLALSSGVSNLTYGIDATDLSVLSAFGAADLHGAARIEGRVEGPSDALTTTGTISAQEVKYAEAISALTVTGQFGGNLPSRDASRATVSAHVVSSFLSVHGHDVEQIALDAAYGARNLDVTAHVVRQGQTVDVTGAVRFAPEAREIHVRSFAFAGPGAPWTLDARQGDVTITYSPQAVTIAPLALVRGGERVEAGGSVALDRSAAGDASFHAVLTGIDVASVYQLAVGTPRVQATANADLTMTGVVTAPVMHGTIDLGSGRVTNVPFSRASARVDLAQSRLSIEARVEQPAGGAISVTGVLPISAHAGDIDLQVQSQTVDLGLLQAFTTAVEHVTGQAALDVHVTGPIDRVAVAGTAAMTDGGFLVEATGVTYMHASASIRFDGQRVVLDQASIADSDGHVLTASGSGDLLSSDRAIDVSITSDGMHVLHNELGEVEATANIHATGELAAPHVTGTIAISRAVIQADEVLRQLASENAAPVEPAPTTLPPLSQVRRQAPGPSAKGSNTAGDTAAGAPPATTGLFSRADVSLAISMPDNILLRGHDLHASANGIGLGDVTMTIGGTVHIQKAPGQAPVIVGSAEAVRGSYTFQGRRFDVERGSTVTFRGMYPIDPSIDVTGDREVSGIVAQVHVTGTARRPSIQLSSTPPLDESDVLSLIIFNAPVSQLGDSQQVDVADQAERMAASAVATPLASAIGRALDLDVFEILTPSAGEAGQVQVGHQVSERLFVGFRQEFGESQASRLSFDYRLTKALSVLTSLGQGEDRTKQTNENEAAGVDLLFTVRY